MVGDHYLCELQCTMGLLGANIRPGKLVRVLLSQDHIILLIEHDNSCNILLATNNEHVVIMVVRK